MRKILFVALAMFVLIASAQSRPFKVSSTTERLQTRMQQQQKRIDALSKRGRLANYQQITRSGIPRSSFHFSPTSAIQNVDTRRRMEGLEEVMKRETAINLAALGFTPADIATYRKSNIDLYDVVHRFFSADTTPEESMLLADTIFVGAVLKSEKAHPRLDGFNSAISFQIVKSLKGPLVKGDIVNLPQVSGIGPNGSRRTNTSDINDAAVGQRYLLVMSRSWYGQWVAERSKQEEVGNNALAFLAYQMASDGSLKPYPRPTADGKAPKDLNGVELALKHMPAINK